MTEFETKVLESLDAIQTLLEALVGDCEATKTLEKRRAAKAASQAAWRAKQAEKADDVESTSVVEKNEEEKRDGKRDIPPTPPIERKGENREEARKDSHDTACAREESVDSTGQIYLPGMISAEEANRIEAERVEAEKQAEREIFEEHFETYFTSWWKLYPKKEGKQRCRDKLHKILNEKFEKGGNLAVDALMSVIFKSMNEWLACDRWNRDGKAFVCKPETWLKQERYLDTDLGVFNPNHNVKRVTQNQNCIVTRDDLPL